MQNVREAITNLLMNGVDRAYDTNTGGSGSIVLGGAATS